MIRDFVALATELRGLYGSRLPPAWDDIMKARAVTGASRSGFREKATRIDAAATHCATPALEVDQGIASTVPHISII